jgi:hypothetical protein
MEDDITVVMEIALLVEVCEIVVEVAKETASEAVMDTALGAVEEIVEYMLALLLVEMILLPSALQMKGFCTGLLGFCVLVVRSRQVVVGRDETCRNVEKVLDGAVFELPVAVVVWSKAGVDFFHFTFPFGFSFCKTLFLMITHSVRGVTMSRLDRLQIDC